MSKSSSPKNAVTQMAEDSLAVGQVLAYRLPMMAMSVAFPSKKRNDEMALMLTEKAEANFAGLMAMQGFWAGAMWHAWTSTSPTDMLEQAAEAYAEPGRRTLRANVKRLARKKL